jgi:uridine phosphorylase
MLKELGRNDWLEMLNLAADQVPAVLILRGTRNLQMQYEVTRAFFSNVRDLGAPNGLIESVLVGELDGTPVGFGCVYGASMASEAVHIFGVLGTRAVIQTGNCGGLADGMAAGDLVLPTVAHCGEGAAQYYVPATQRISASAELRASQALAKLENLRVHEGPIYTTAALLAEGEAEIEAWHRQGFIAVDMETATSFAVAASFGMARASILYVFDNPRQKDHLLLADPAKDERRSRANGIARDLAFALALELSRSVQSTPHA